MKAILIEEAGDVENLVIKEINKPQIKPNEVLVRVKAISINPVDVKARAHEGVLQWIYNTDRPVILGWDISGEIVEIGDDVTTFKVGDEAFGMVNFFGNGKGYAEYVAAPATHLALKPSKITHQEAAAIAMVGSTAYQALFDVAKIKKGDRVLIHAAAGGVGHIAIQMAKYAGAYVIGTSSAKNKDFVLALGANEHIDYNEVNLTDIVKNIDIVIDTIQGDTLNQSVIVTRDGGKIVTLPTPTIPKELAIIAETRNISIEFMMVESKQETINAIASLLTNGIIKPHIWKAFNFDGNAQSSSGGGNK